MLPLRPKRAGQGYLWVALVLITALAYLWGLDGVYIPRFGDEMVYAHIARLTAESGHWLPLQSDIPNMRNTKPPLLFWQAMVAGQWGADWRLAALRLPSVIYTWATALMVALLAARLWGARQASAQAQDAGAGEIAGKPDAPTTGWMTGCIAATVFLLFFSTVRYNRTYLTSGPETFWLFGVMAAVAWAPSRMLASRLWFPLLAAVAIALGCLYKSFVMAGPVGLALFLCHWLAVPAGARPNAGIRHLAVSALTSGVSVVLAVALFSLWLVIDPSPADVWREFVMGENMGKVNKGASYLAKALGGTDSVWVILTACFSNAGALLPLVAGAAVAAFQAARRGQAMGQAEKVLWIWIAALTLFFLVPSQRTTRYLVPAMPAVAIIVALYWPRIHRPWFVATAALCVATMAVLGIAAWGGTRATGDAALYSPAYWAMLAFMAAAGIAAFTSRRLARAASLVTALGAFAALTGLYAPFNAALGHFEPAVVAQLKGRPVAVANQFIGQSERYRFLLPGVAVKPVESPATRSEQDLSRLFAVAPLALVTRWPGDPPCQDCRVLGSRWEPAGRPGGRAVDAVLHPQDFWFAREYIVERPAP
ncbi:MAG: glycosyl transferase [Burkholderiaceae bacterium]|nr:glycosyl transferase [Burkholderiaceae bacterium]